MFGHVLNLNQRLLRRPARILFFLHSNIRSGANLSMLRHAAYMARFGHDVSVIFEQDWHGTDITFVPGHEALRISLLADRVVRDSEVVDVAITNWWTCAYNITAIPARPISGMARKRHSMILPCSTLPSTCSYMSIFAGTASQVRSPKICFSGDSGRSLFQMVST